MWELQGPCWSGQQTIKAACLMVTASRCLSEAQKRESGGNGEGEKPCGASGVACSFGVGRRSSWGARGCRSGWAEGKRHLKRCALNHQCPVSPWTVLGERGV